MQQQCSCVEYMMDDVSVVFIHFILCTLHAVSHQKCVIEHEVKSALACREGNLRQA